MTQACPAIASVHWNPIEDSKEEIIEWFEVYKKLPYQIRMGLIDEATKKHIFQIAQKFNICKIEEVGEISRIIRDSFVIGYFDEKAIKKRIIDKLKLTEEETIKLMVDLLDLRKRIGSVENDAMARTIEKISIIPALKKFPEINKQLIGERKIKLSQEENLSEQNIKNWIDDYTLEKGAQFHSNLERSDYVFNSKNVKNLAFLEKKQLLSILESYDNETDLSVDVKRKIVLFDVEEQEISPELRRSMEKKAIEEKEIQAVEVEKKIAREVVKEEAEKMETEQKEVKEIQSKHTINLKDI